MRPYNLCIIKPNKGSFSETFITEHIDRLAGNKKVLYGGAFPVYDHEGKYLIKSKFGLLTYLIQKKIFHKLEIKVRTQALASYLKREKIDIVFAEYGMVGAMVTAACKMASLPLVIHYHGADVYHEETLKRYQKLYYEAFAYASAFVAVSVEMMESLKQLGAPGDKVYHVSCGVDTNAFPLLNIKDNSQHFLSVGRFVEKKSPSSVVKSFQIVVEKYPAAKLTMVGTGPLFEEVKILVDELDLKNSITLSGVLNRDEIKKLMLKSICFVQHSVTAINGDREGTPVTVLEAASSGLPIVSTRHGGIKDAIIDGKTGYLVPEHDINGMAERMIEVLQKPLEVISMGREGRKHILANYNMQGQIDKLNHIIQQSIVS